MDKKEDKREIVTTLEIKLGDSEILGTPKNQQKDKKRRKKVDRDSLLKPKKLQKHKLRNKKKQKVAATTEPSVIDSDDPGALVKPQKPKRLRKIVDELSNRLDKMTEIVKKLKKNSDLLEEETSNTSKEKVVDNECYFESEDADLKNRQTIFVLGFDCSFPKDEIKRTLIKHFSSCGEVSRVYIPFHCDTGSPMGFAFINMGNRDKALTLDGSYLGGMRLTVTMAIKRSEYYGYTNRRGCQRCGIASTKRFRKRFYEDCRLRIPLEPSNT
ncbi:polyadenylate-binding protein 2-B-like [Raphanus sativus]|nr:polyadenylate-binding protein 2-B-like [Raphanus sativus]